jgi:hypothetical protein
MSQQQRGRVSRHFLLWLLGSLMILMILSEKELAAMDSYGFTGARTESGDSLVFLRACYYDSEIGRSSTGILLLALIPKPGLTGQIDKCCARGRVGENLAQPTTTRLCCASLRFSS